MRSHVKEGAYLCCEDRWWNMEVATGNLTKFVQLVVIKVPIEAAPSTS